MRALITIVLLAAFGAAHGQCTLRNTPLGGTASTCTFRTDAGGRLGVSFELTNDTWALRHQVQYDSIRYYFPGGTVAVQVYNVDHTVPQSLVIAFKEQPLDSMRIMHGAARYTLAPKGYHAPLDLQRAAACLVQYTQPAPAPVPLVQLPQVPQAEQPPGPALLMKAGNNLAGAYVLSALAAITFGLAAGADDEAGRTLGLVLGGALTIGSLGLGISAGSQINKAGRAMQVP